MPVPLAGRRPYGVTGTQNVHRSTLGLNETASGQNLEDLTGFV